MNPLKALWEEQGQAAWLDNIERDLLTGGGLGKLVVEDGIRRDLEPVDFQGGHHRLQIL